ncbi:MAG: hypothetical protein ACREDO_10435 [Methyloceanibacter sp.]
MSESHILTCDHCRSPLTRIDHYGDRLDGCVSCNLWGAPGSDRLLRRLNQEDIDALRGLSRPRLRVV